MRNVLVSIPTLSMLLFGLACVGFKDDRLPGLDDTAAIASDDSPGGTGDFEDCDNGADDDGDGLADCDDPDCAPSADCFDGAVDAGELVPCGQQSSGVYVVDSWRVTAGSGGATFRVDTVDQATAFDPMLLDINGGVVVGDDEFECSFPAPARSCPEVELDPGEHHLVVLGRICFSGELGEYQVQITQGSGSLVAGDLDDVPWSL